MLPTQRRIHRQGLPRRVVSASLWIVASMLLLAGCTTTDFDRPSQRAEARAEAMAQNGEHEDAAGAYIGLASDATGAERDRLTLLAVEQWLDAGDGRRAGIAMSDVAPPAAAELRGLWDTNRAALLLWEGKPDEALDILRPMASRPLGVERRTRVDMLRGDAWFQKKDPSRAVALYLQLEQSLSDRRDIQIARLRLWSGLLVSDPLAMRASEALTSSAVVRGWLSLGALAVATGQQGIGWSNGLSGWRDDYAGHPAMSVIENFEVPDPALLSYPRQVALLLPLSGGSESLGDAIQNGFLAAYYRATAGLDDPQQVRVYDVGGSARNAYLQAVEDGAEFVVGPLLRNAVAELAAEPVLPVPMLTLNYLPDGLNRPPGLFQFALSPDDEAAAAADRAIRDGKTRGVALVPNSDWGRRLLESFVDEFSRQGGTLLEHRYYQPSDQDFSFEIENLMGLALSIQRYQRLRANIGGSLQFDPRRRADADFIFLAADAPVGRLLKSQLKFHYSGDLPVYSTSRIYAQDGRSNSDLNGVGFSDTPWTIAPQPWLRDLPDTFAKFWPEQRSLLQSRLHAMGYDAYLLVNELYSTGGRGMPFVDGATGRLYLDESGRIHRQLPWAVFQGGQPVAAPAPGRQDDEDGDFFDGREGEDGDDDRLTTFRAPLDLWTASDARR